MAKPHSKDAIKRAERERTVVELLRAGVAYDVIVEKTGITKPTISKIKKKHLAIYHAETQDEIAELQRLELSRIDRLWNVFYPKAVAGSFQAFDRCAKLMGMRSAISGLNAPTKIAPTDPTGEKEYQGGGLSALLAAHRESRKGGGE